MKKILVLSLLILGMQAVYASTIPMPNSVIYDNTTSPYSNYFDGSVRPVKSGEAQCTSYFKLVSTGKCGLKDAMNDGGITKINSIDFVSKSILFYHKAKIVVYGE